VIDYYVYLEILLLVVFRIRVRFILMPLQSEGRIMPLLVCLAISRKVRLQTMNLCWDIVKLMPFVYRSLA
jgi:hypothetical protein